MSKIKKTVESLVIGDRLSRKKISYFLLFINVITSAAVSIYIPCLKHMAIDLNTTNALMQMTIVAHLIGEFLGRILCGPLIDIYGFRAIILPSLTISILGHLGCMISESLLFFIVMRFIQAVGASVVYIVSQSIINETFDEKGKNSVMGILELYQPIAWILSPFAGSIIMEVSNWRLSFLVLALAQMIGIVFFKAYPTNSHKKKRIKFSFSIIIQDYKSILKNSVFVIYALIPGLFAGGYMIFATSCPFICSQFYAGSSGNIAIFSTIPLFFYIIATFAYRIVVDRLGVKIARRVGTSVYTFFGIYLSYLVIFDIHWSPRILLILMCIQCFGSAFLVPVSVLKALQNSAILSTNIGASTVVIFRNLIMSFCISAGVKFNSSITTIMACIFITVATIILLITTRKFLRSRANRKICK